MLYWLIAEGVALFVAGVALGHEWRASKAASEMVFWQENANMWRNRALTPKPARPLIPTEPEPLLKPEPMKAEKRAKH